MRQDFLGKGWAHPVSLEEDGLRMAAGEESIRQSIRLILSTRPGERPCHPDFGCGVEDYLFGPINSAVLSQISQTVKEALQRYEPRIVVEAVRARPAEGRLEVEIDYRIRRTNSRHNLVYPFYLEER